MSGLVVPFPAVFASDAPTNGRGFTSFKCSSAIEYTRRCCRDALIQASLEPEITSIEPLLEPNLGPADTYFVFAVVTQGRRCAIALTEHTNSNAFIVPDGFDAGLAINKASILADPAKTAARTIWAHRDTSVPPLFSINLTRRLKGNPAGFRLGDLEDELADTGKNWIDCIFAMACDGSILVDYRSAITDETLVRASVASRN